MSDEGLFYTQQIDFEPEPEQDEGSDVESFDDYLWMEHEEEFEKSEMQRLEEEALMEECVEAMQEAAEQEETDLLSLSCFAEDERPCHLTVAPPASESTLNPLAIEFVPANWFGQVHPGDAHQHSRKRTKTG